MSGCRSCSRRLFHSVDPAVAKQRSPNWWRDLLTKHVRLSADRRGRRPAAVTSVHSSMVSVGVIICYWWCLMTMMTTTTTTTTMMMMMWWEGDGDDITDDRDKDALFACEAELFVARQTTEVGHHLFLHHSCVRLITGSAYTNCLSTRPSSLWLLLPTEATQFATENLELSLHQQRRRIHVLLQRTSAHVGLQPPQCFSPLRHLRSLHQSSQRSRQEFTTADNQGILGHGSPSRGQRRSPPPGGCPLQEHMKIQNKQMSLLLLDILLSL